MPKPRPSGFELFMGSAGLEPLQTLQPPSVALPAGYEYGVTRGADLFIRNVYPECFDELAAALDAHRFSVCDMVAAGGGRSNLARGWDDRLRSMGWGKRNVTVARLVDNRYVSSARSHEIDMFKGQDASHPYPGIAIEMEWNNKDPFFDRDLGAFEMLHTQGIIGAGVIVTRGPELQRLIKSVIPGTKKKSGDYNLKYGESTTHWRKLVERVERGGGGSCPLLLVGIQPERFDSAGRIREAHDEYVSAASRGKGAVRRFHANIVKRGEL
jgi:Restriction endonuclease BglII